MPRYRCDFELSTSQYEYRLEICTDSATLNDIVTDLPRAGTVLELGDVSAAFDVLPFGMAMPAKSSGIKLWYSNLPTELQEALREKKIGDTYNIFYLWYKGSGGLYKLLFAGTHENFESVTYEPDGIGGFSVSLSLVDVFYKASATVSMGTYCAQFDTDGTGWNAANLQEIYGVGSVDLTESYYRVNVTGSAGVYPDSIDRVFDVLTAQIGLDIVENYQYVESGGQIEAIEKGADYSSKLVTGANRAVTYYSVASGEPREAAAVLTTDQMLLATRIRNDTDTALIGGLLSTQDKYNWRSKFPSIWDFLKLYAETSYIKVSSIPFIADYSGNKFLAYEWRAERVFESGVTPTYNINTVDIISCKEGVGTVGRCEVRLDLYAGSTAINTWVNEQAHTLSTQSMTFEPLWHNVPTMRSKIKVGGDAGIMDVYDNGLLQSNLMCYEYSSDLVGKVHEKTTINTGLFSVTADVADSETPVNIDYDSAKKSYAEEQLEYQLWLNKLQAGSCLPNALILATMQAFGSLKQTELVAKFRLTDQTFDLLGAVCEITGDLADTFPHINFSSAVITAMKFLFAEDAVEITFLTTPTV